MADDAHHEIVIVRRGHHGDYDGHHGGAWKIAFADFMTAMMAFFLVMWLISANDKTKATVARYFNPVRYVDATVRPPGLDDAKKDDTAPGAQSAVMKDAKNPSPRAPEKPPERPPETPSGREKRLDAALRDSPYAALAEIAGKNGPGQIVRVPKPTNSAPVIGRRGGDSFRDPFAPPHGVALDDVASDSDLISPAAAPVENTVDKTDKTDKAAEDKAEAKAGQIAKANEAKEEAIKQDAAKQAALKTELVAAVQAVNHGTGGPEIDVKRVPEGVLVSLTDTAEFSMFANGSAVPSRRVVLLMDQVAQILKDKPGQVVVRGYTDNKPFHGNRYDNWHLSLDRAQVTHYMLVRGGLTDERIGHIEGYADHVAKTGVDPSSPVNRRIEILLKDVTP